jgi:hypothetical protein
VDDAFALVGSFDAELDYELDDVMNGVVQSKKNRNEIPDFRVHPVAVKSGQTL